MLQPHSSNSLPKYACLLLVAWTLCGLFSSSTSSFARPVEAGVTVANDDAETVFTCSEDGKTIYMWQYYSSKPPKFIGQSEAVLNE